MIKKILGSFSEGNKISFSTKTRHQNSSNSRLSVIKGPNLNFTKDERFIMEDIHNKFEVAWLENFIMLNRCELI